jgi:hypothetical protein
MRVRERQSMNLVSRAKREGRTFAESEKAISGASMAFHNKKPLFLAEQRLFLQLVANQGFEPRTCGL